MDESSTHSFAEDRPPTARQEIRPVRVAVIGRRSLCRLSLQLVLQKCGEGIEPLEFATADQAARPRSAGERIDVALVSLAGPGAPTEEQLRDMSARLGRVPLVVQLSHSSPDFVSSLIAAGIRGIVDTDLGGQVMVAALRLVAAGGIYAPPALGPARPGGGASAASGFPGRPTLRLGQREAEVLRLIERCRSNREIAQELGLAEATVKIHVRNLLRKTGARNRVELALLAAQAGTDA